MSQSRTIFLIFFITNNLNFFKVSISNKQPLISNFFYNSYFSQVDFSVLFCRNQIIWSELCLGEGEGDRHHGNLIKYLPLDIYI